MRNRNSTECCKRPMRPKKIFFHKTYSEETTLDLGRALGAALTPGVTVLLSGDLGTGKTTLVRGIGDALGVTRVRSPSFTLVNEYRTGTASFSIVHADLYRLKPGEVEYLGLEEYHETPCVLLVEWPERWTEPPERGVLKIFIEAKGENERAFGITSTGGLADLVLQNLQEAVIKEDGKIDPGVGLQPALD